MLDQRLSARVAALTPFQQVSAQLKEALRRVAELEAQIAALTAAGGKVAAKPRAAKVPKAPEGDLAEYFADVDADVVRDFKAHRARLKAAITVTVMKGFVREANKANMTLEAALVICCERGWRFVKADWLERERAQGAQQAGGRPAKFDPVAHVNRNSMSPASWDNRVIDVTPR